MKRLEHLIARALGTQSTWLVVLITFVWLAATTWTRPLILPDEGRYVGVAWQMLVDGQLSVPRLDGLPFFHKPPLFYWITALSLQLFGANEWAARLASVLSATLMVGLLFWFLKTYVNRQLAIVAAIILATQPFLFGGAQYANLDMTVAGMIAATVLVTAAAVFRAERGESYRLVLTLAYALAGFGFLAKGLIGILLPGGIIFFWLLGRRRFDSLRRLFWLPAIAMFFVVALPWMLYMQWRYPGFFDYYIVYQHFHRFLEKGFNNPHPFWFYVPVLIGLTLPWSIQLWRLANKSYWFDSKHGAVRGLMLSWFLVVLVFFSIPTSKLIGYVLPALVPLAFFMAEPFARRFQGADSIRALRTYTWYAAIAVVICLAAAIALVVSPLPTTKGLAKKILTEYRPGDQVVMLERLRYDLGFYLRTGQPSIVAENWDDPEIQLGDSWRKELYDAAQFEPDVAAPLLIKPGEVAPRLCNARDQNFWLLGDHNSAEIYPFLTQMAPYAEDGKLRLWHVPAGTALTFCAEMPKNGPK